MSEGLRLWAGSLRSLLPVALLSWLPGEALRLVGLLWPMAPRCQVALELLSLLLSFLGAGFLSAALIGALARGRWQGALGQGARLLPRVARTQGLVLLTLALLGLPALLGGLMLTGRCGGLLPLSPELPQLPVALQGALLCFVAALLASYAGLRASLGMVAAADGLAGVAALRRSLRLTDSHQEDLLTFGLLVTAWMTPVLLAMGASSLLLQEAHFWGHYALTLLLGFLLTLQGQGATLGLALLYADACAQSGTPTRLCYLRRST